MNSHDTSNVPIISINSTDLIFDPQIETVGSELAIPQDSEHTIKKDSWPPSTQLPCTALDPQHRKRKAKKITSSNKKTDKVLAPITISRKEFYQGYQLQALNKAERKKKHREQQNRITVAFWASGCESTHANEETSSIAKALNGDEHSKRRCGPEKLTTANKTKFDRFWDNSDTSSSSYFGCDSDNSIATGTTNISRSSKRSDGLTPTEYSFIERKRKLRPFLAWSHVVDYAPHYLPQDGHLHADMAKQMARVRKHPRRPIAVQEGDISPLHSFLPTLLNPPDEAFDKNGFLRALWLYEARPEMFTPEGWLQDFVVLKHQPRGISDDFWNWLVGAAREPRWTREMLKELEICYTTRFEPRQTEMANLTKADPSIGFIGLDWEPPGYITGYQREQKGWRPSFPVAHLPRARGSTGGDSKKESSSEEIPWSPLGMNVDERVLVDEIGFLGFGSDHGVTEY